VEIKKLIDFENPTNCFSTIKPRNFELDGGVAKAVMRRWISWRWGKTRRPQTGTNLVDFGVNTRQILAELLLCLNDVLQRLENIGE
jgi:hypothetical protein